MSIKFAILGFLSWKPLTGYALKKMFASSVTLHWSGNNNQIYKTLIELHREQLVVQEIQQQLDHPARKIYTITEQGLTELKNWVLSSPELPQLKHSFLIQLLWTDQLQSGELDKLLSNYEEEVQVQKLMLEAQSRRQSDLPDRTPRERYLVAMIMKNWQSFYEHELSWVRQLREDLRRKVEL